MITVVPKPLAPGEVTLRWLEHEKKRFPAQGATRAEFERAIEDVKSLMDVLSQVQDLNAQLKWELDLLEAAEVDVNKAWAGIGRALA